MAKMKFIIITASSSYIAILILCENIYSSFTFHHVLSDIFELTWFKKKTSFDMSSYVIVIKGNVNCCFWLSIDYL